MKAKLLLFFVTVCFSLLATSSNALAESAANYPTKQVRIIVPTPPGGGLDVMARALGNALQARWKQPVIILNRPGASMTIGAADVANSKPDGYTILFGMDASFVSNVLLLKLPYDPKTAFAPVSLLAKGDQFVVANKDLPANNLKELRALARAKPGTLNFGNHAIGSPTNVAFELMNRREGLDMQDILYPGIAPVMNALLAGNIQLTLVGGAVAGQLLEAGRIKALAATGEKRSSLFPKLPTVAEQGFPYMASSVWYALAVPRKTPKAIVDRISRDVAAVMRDPAFEKQFVTSKGMVSVGSTPEELDQWIQKDLERTRQMFKDAGITRQSIR